VEYDIAQPPVGAVVGLRALDRKYSQDLVKDTQTNVVFYANGQRVAGAGVTGFDETLFDQIIPELEKIDADPTYKDKGHTEIRDLSPTLGAVFTKLDGDAFELGAGFAVMRQRVTIQGSGTFLSNADETDRRNVSWPALVGIVLAGLVFGLLLTFLEHDRPLSGLRLQAGKLRKGEVDLLQLPQLSGKLRDIGGEINAGIERVAEKGGGAPRKAADLEAIVGPVPAEPSMSAFAFPMAEPVSAVRNNNPMAPPPPSGPKPLINKPAPPVQKPAPFPPVGPIATLQQPNTLQQPPTAPTAVMPAKPIQAAMPQIVPAPAPPPAMTPVQALRPPMDEHEDATTVSQVPQEVLARASGELNAEEAEWPTVFDEFLRTKKQCKEPTEGLTFDKFKQTLRKNRDALVARHNCKRVKFTVYVKDGRASLKATPIKD
jgi:hypothetical protein